MSTLWPCTTLFRYRARQLLRGGIARRGSARAFVPPAGRVQLLVMAAAAFGRRQWRGATALSPAVPELALLASSVPLCGVRGGRGRAICVAGSIRSLPVFQARGAISRSIFFRSAERCEGIKWIGT